jgi:TRAP-type C4-dicarboxylate transport system permease small subunit
VARLIDRSVDLLAGINAPTARWGRNAAAMLLALMVGLATTQILSRALFNHTLDWADELARMALVWSVLLSAPYGYRAGAQVAITAFADALPTRLLLAIAVFVNLLVAWICATLFVESLDLVRRGLTIVAASMPFRMAWVYAIVPLSLALLVLVAVEIVLQLARALRRGTRELRLAGLMPVLQQDPD